MDHNKLSAERGKVEIVTDFTFSDSKITADSDCSHEIQRCLLLGRKAIKPRQHIKKQRYHFADKDITKVHIVKAMVFPVVTYRHKNWSANKAERKELMLLNCSAREDS